MKLQKKKYPIVWAMVEDFGISSSLSGNAINSAAPSNILQMWHSHPHTMIYPYLGRLRKTVENDELDHAIISTGQPISSDQDFLSEQFKKITANSDQPINKLLKETAERSSALHLIGNLSTDIDSGGDLDHLLKIIELAVAHKIFRIFVHLIVNDFENTDKKLFSSFKSSIEKVSSIDNVEVVSVLQRNSLENGVDSKKFSNSLKTILNGEGKRALDVNQAINYLSSATQSPEPISIIISKKYVAKVNDLDSLIFFNHNNKSFSDLILTVASSGSISASVKLPKFLSIATMFNPFCQNIPQVRNLFTRKFDSNLTKLLAENSIKQLYISDVTRGYCLDHYFSGGCLSSGEYSEKLKLVLFDTDASIRSYQENLNKILHRVASGILENYDFIFIDIPLLDKRVRSPFAEVVTRVKMIDNFVGEVLNNVLEHNGTFVFSSNHSGAEKMVGRSSSEVMNNKSFNPVPFLIANSPSQPSRRMISKEFNFPVLEAARKKYFEIDILPTMLDLFGIKWQDGLLGKSVLDELII